MSVIGSSSSLTFASEWKSTPTFSSHRNLPTELYRALRNHGVKNSNCLMTLIEHFVCQGKNENTVLIAAAALWIIARGSILVSLVKDNAPTRHMASRHKTRIRPPPP